MQQPTNVQSNNVPGELKNVLILTDSLGFPRVKGVDKVSIAETFVEYVRSAQTYCRLIHLGIPAGTIVDLQRVANYYSSTSFSCIILQAGIVDCAPRALHQFEFEVAKRLRLIRMIKPFTSFLRRTRNICYTKPAEFERIVRELQQTFPESLFIASGILPARPQYEKKVPGITRQIEIFNAILSKHSLFIDNSDFPDEGIASDHHHLTACGNRILAQRILRVMARQKVANMSSGQM